MKYNVQNLAFLSAVISFAACEQHKQATIDDSGTEVVKVRQPTADTVDNSTDTIVKPIEKGVLPANHPAKSADKPLRHATKDEQPNKDVGAKPAPSITIKGVVKEINNGKDGYTAKLETPDGQIIAVTISRSNLTNPKQYRTVAVGDILKVSGESWKLDGQSQITVRQIY
jgi:hypothetical protein